MPEFIKLDGELENAELVCTKTDGTKYDFNHFLLKLKFIEKIYEYEVTPDEAIGKQEKLKELINKLNNYGPRIFKKIEEKNRVLKSAKELFDARDDIMDLFEKGTFPYKENYLKQQQQKRIKKRIKKGKKEKIFQTY